MRQRKYAWATFNYFEIKLPVSVAEQCTHPGPCDSDVKKCRQLPYVKKQLSKMEPGRSRPYVDEILRIANEALQETES